MNNFRGIYSSLFHNPELGVVKHDLNGISAVNNDISGRKVISIATVWTGEAIGFQQVACLFTVARK